MKGRMAFAVFGTRGVLAVTDDARLYEARDALDGVLDSVDRACSRFRPDSDIERVNEGAGRAVAVGSVLLDAVEVALQAARRTDGAVDPTVGQALKLLGYDRDFGQFGPHTALPEVPVPLSVQVMAVPGWREVVLDRAAGTIRIARGTRLDLGATAKAWAADQGAEMAARRARCGVLVSLGGDLAVAGAPLPGGWGIQLSQWCGAEFDEDVPAVQVHAGGLATSSTAVRRWMNGDRPVHHIIDPATSRPAATVWSTVTVAAGSCVDANVAATAAIVQGESAPNWLSRHGLPARLLRRDGGVVRVAGWPADRTVAA